MERFISCPSAAQQLLSDEQLLVLRAALRRDYGVAILTDSLVEDRFVAYARAVAVACGGARHDAAVAR